MFCVQSLVTLQVYKSIMNTTHTNKFYQLSFNVYLEDHFWSTVTLNVGYAWGILNNILTKFDYLWQHGVYDHNVLNAI